MVELKSAVRSVQRNKSLKWLLYGIFVLSIVFNTYDSIYGIASKNCKLSKKLLKLKEKETPDQLAFRIFRSDVSGVDRLPETATLREQLHFKYPYDKNEPIPKTIWQTWKTSRDHESFKPKFYKFTQQWMDKNPGASYNLIPDAAAGDLINHLYQSIPKVLHAYDILPKSILKADFFRYLILFARGGVYSDIDTVSLKPLEEWPSFNTTIYDEPNHAGLIIGIEADPDRPDWNTYYAKRVQFCQWTIQSKKGHPALGELIAKITEITLQKEQDGTLKKVVGKDAGDDIMSWTGPGIYTDELFRYFNNLLKYDPGIKIKNPTKPNEHNEGLDIYKNGIDWKFFTLMEQPIVLDDVLILPITSFSPGVGHMGSKPISHPQAYVRHMFEGSWKPEEERHIGEDAKQKEEV